MKVIETDIPEVKIVEPTVFGDERGFFLESWNERTFRQNGLEPAFVQDNHSRSAKGTLRGLHYQIQQPQGKLVRVVTGAVYDVAVDIRKSSPTFARWVGVTLSADNHCMLWVPPGFAHGFLVLEDGTDFMYKCTDFYAPEHERTILWNDGDLAIDWPLEGIGAPILSQKDAVGAVLGEAELYP